MTHTKTTLTALKQGIPPEKFTVKLQRTVLGLVIAAGAAAGVAFRDWPWYVAVPLGLLGGTVWSGEIMVGAFKIVLAAFRDVWTTVKGGGGATP
jgi:hypothetical protein